MSDSAALEILYGRKCTTCGLRADQHDIEPPFPCDEIDCGGFTDLPPRKPSREDGARQDKREAFERNREAEWDAMTLDVKLRNLSLTVDSLLSDRLQHDERRRCLDAAGKLENLATYVFSWMRDHGETI